MKGRERGQMGSTSEDSSSEQSRRLEEERRDVAGKPAADILVEAKECNDVAVSLIGNSCYLEAKSYLEQGDVHLTSCKNICFDWNLRFCLLNNWLVSQQNLCEFKCSLKCAWSMACEIEKSLELDLPRYESISELTANQSELQFVSSYLRRKEMLAMCCLKFINPKQRHYLAGLEKVIPRTAQRAVSFMRDAFQGYYKHWTPAKSEVSNLHKTINMLKVFKTLGLYVLEPSDIEECIILTRVREALQKISKDLLVEFEQSKKARSIIEETFRFEAKTYQQFTAQNEFKTEFEPSAILRKATLMAIGYYFQAKEQSQSIGSENGRVLHLAAIDICLTAAPYRSRLLEELLATFKQIYNQDLTSEEPIEKELPVSIPPEDHKQLQISRVVAETRVVQSSTAITVITASSNPSKQEAKVKLH